MAFTEFFASFFFEIFYLKVFLSFWERKDITIPTEI